MSDMLETPTLKADYDHMPRETYAGLGYEAHRYADYIPVADSADQFLLRQSIEDIGLIDPIMLFEGAILDGRHRYAACVKTGQEPRFVDFTGTEEDALKYVLAKNIARRNLTTSQKLSLRDKLQPEIERLRAAGKANMAASFTTGGKAVNTADEVAGLVGLSRETIRQADKVAEAKELFPENEFLAEMAERVLSGEVSVKKAYVDTSAELDRLANKDTAAVDPAKQRAVLVSAIGKAHALLVHWDPGTLTENWEAADQLSELVDWCSEAYNHAG